MSTLRTQMTYDMLVRGLAEQTQRSYVLMASRGLRLQRGPRIVTHLKAIEKEALQGGEGDKS
jgi:hypothetical protein